MDAEQQERAFLADIELVNKNLEKFNNLSELLDLPECVDVVQHNIIKLYVNSLSSSTFTLLTLLKGWWQLGRRLIC